MNIRLRKEGIEVAVAKHIVEEKVARVFLNKALLRWNKARKSYEDLVNKEKEGFEIDEELPVAKRFKEVAVDGVVRAVDRQNQVGTAIRREEALVFQHGEFQVEIPLPPRRVSKRMAERYRRLLQQ